MLPAAALAPTPPPVATGPAATLTPFDFEDGPTRALRQSILVGLTVVGCAVGLHLLYTLWREAAWARALPPRGPPEGHRHEALSPET